MLVLFACKFRNEMLAKVQLTNNRLLRPCCESIRLHSDSLNGRSGNYLKLYQIFVTFTFEATLKIRNNWQ